MNIEDVQERATELAEAHWEYIEALLTAHGEDVEMLSVAEFHYKEAFKHGYKHGHEDCYQDNTGLIKLVDKPGG